MIVFVIDPEFWMPAGWNVMINNADWKSDDWKVRNNYTGLQEDQVQREMSKIIPIFNRELDCVQNDSGWHKSL